MDKDTDFEESVHDAIHGEVHLTVRKGGKVVEEWQESNMIVDSGRNKLAKIMGCLYGGGLTKVGVGSSANEPSVTDTGLTDAQYVPIVSAEDEGSMLKLTFSLGANDANGLNIRELGLFFEDGTMFNRKVRSGTIPKQPDIEIDGWWNLYF